MKKIKFNKKFWINFGVLFTISGFFVGTLTAAVLSDNNINGQRTFLTVSETVLADGVEKGFLLPQESIGPKEKFTGFVHIQTTPTFDGAFNEQMVTGIADFMGYDWDNRHKVPVFKSPNNQPQNYEGQYASMRSKGTKITTVGGFDHIPAITNLLADSGWNDYGFVLIDQRIQSDRVASALFQGEQSSFLTGVATGLYLNEHYEDYKSGGLKVGFYGGRPLDTVVGILGGFEQGIEYWNSTVRHNFGDDLNRPVELIDLGDFDSFFVGGFEPDRAIAITERLLNLGADAIFPVAGVQTREVVKVVNQRDQATIVIGVDTPMEDNNTFQQINNVTKRPTIPFSSMKDIRNMTARIVSNIYEGKEGINVDNGVAGLGWINVGNISNGLVDVSKPGIELFNLHMSKEQIDEIYLAASKATNIFKF